MEDIDFSKLDLGETPPELLSAGLQVVASWIELEGFEWTLDNAARLLFCSREEGSASLRVMLRVGEIVGPAFAGHVFIERAGNPAPKISFLPVPESEEEREAQRKQPITARDVLRLPLEMGSAQCMSLVKVRENQKRQEHTPALQPPGRSVNKKRKIRTQTANEPTHLLVSLP